LSYGRILMKIVSLNYNGNRMVSPNPVAGYARRKSPEVSWIRLSIRAKSRAGCGNRGLAKREDL